MFPKKKMLTPDVFIRDLRPCTTGQRWLQQHFNGSLPGAVRHILNISAADWCVASSNPKGMRHLLWWFIEAYERVILGNPDTPQWAACMRADCGSAEERQLVVTILTEVLTRLDDADWPPITKGSTI